MFVPLRSSIIGRAEQKGVVEIVITDIRAHSKDRHEKCDDQPFGGGAGMVMTPQPIADAVKAVDPDHRAHRVYLSPKGRVLSMPRVKALAKDNKRLLLLCGHYEGVDQRVIDLYIDEEISVGDYVLTGGELPAMVLCDAVIRQLEGALSPGSLDDESFTAGLLEYPQYTRPQVFESLEVPEILLSGHHKNIETWRREQALKITRKNRPDLLNPPNQP
jgi:tRNA (guanine37-N1)-methyltransferase